MGSQRADETAAQYFSRVIEQRQRQSHQDETLQGRVCAIKLIALTT